MARGEIHVGDYGLPIIVTIRDEDDAVRDVSGATVMKLVIERPDETQLIRDAVFTTDGTDGKIQYTVLAGELDQAGKYSIQAYVKIGPNWVRRTDILNFTVEENL